MYICIYVYVYVYIYIVDIRVYTSAYICPILRQPRRGPVHTHTHTIHTHTQF